MGEYRPEKGDYVRAMVEGRVISRGASCISVETGSGRVLYLDPELLTFERLPDPEPEWQVQDVVLSASGTVFRYFGEDDLGERFWRSETGTGVSYHFPARPLTLLVRDGKQVVPK